MKYSFLSLLSLLCLLGFQEQASAQKIAADTASLNYEKFIRESIALKGKEKIEEEWVIVFWASFNGRSMTAVEDVKKLAAKYKNKPLRFVYISGDKNKKSWMHALEDKKMTGEHFVVSDTAKYNNLRRDFKHNSLPALFMYDRAGMVIRKKNVEELAASLVEETKLLPDHPYGWTPPPAVVIPPPPPTEEELLRGWVFHVTKKGESLFSIGKRYGMSVTGLQTVNGLSNSNIYIGQKIKIRPDPYYVAPEPEAAPTEEAKQ